MTKSIQLKVKRQNTPSENSYWQEFKVPYRTNMNVIAALMEIQKNSVDAFGQKVNPVVWECNCLEEVCGACTMIINGKARQACSTLIDNLEQPIVLEPLTKFPIIRDLMIDRQIMFENLKKVKAWVEIDGTFALGPAPRIARKVQEWAYELSKCMTCGCCMEACPNVNQKAPFIGPAAISQVRLFNAHPNGELNKEERLDTLMADGGIADCGNSQNCVHACPKEISLTTSIADMNKQVNTHAFKSWLKK